MIQLVIFEEQTFFRFGVKQAFESNPEIRVAGETVQSLMNAGINGYIGKRQADRVELEKAIRKVAAGGEYIGRVDSSIINRLNKIHS